MRAAILAVASAVCVWAQQPQVESAKLEARTFAGSLASQLASAGAGPFWAAWSEPVISGKHGDMCWNGNGRNELAAATPVRLEGPTSVVVLVRMENAQVDQIRVASLDCRLDAGGLPFYWINGVPSAESVNWLKTQVVSGNQADSAIFAISMQAGPAAERALDDFVAPNQPEKVREKAAFWLGNSRGAHGVDVLKRMLANDSSQKVREQVIFALSQSKEPAGLAAVLDAAKNDKNGQVRGKALFWLAQKAANKSALDVISNAVLNDPDRGVKEQAVFALQQLPPNQGVPLLINVAKNNPDPSVRKKAMFWLGQSNDPRALDFFAQVLKP
jgi:HEAT repeats